MYIRKDDTRLGDATPSPFSQDCQDQVRRKNAEKRRRVAVVGGGFAGLMAARSLGQFGFDVTVFEARERVGGRVSSNREFSEGRITEEGAELIGSFHTTWLALAREYGLTMISRMDSRLYEQAGLNVKLSLGRDLTMDEIVKLEKEMRKRVLEPMARDASQIADPSRPWLFPSLRLLDSTRVSDALEKRYRVKPTELLWKMLEFRLVNDEVAPLDKMNFLGLLCKVRAGQRLKFRYEDDDDKKTRLMRYWDELEIFRCADGCEALAKRMVDHIQSKGFQDAHRSTVKVVVKTAVTHIDLSQSKGPGIWLEFKKVIDQQHEKLAAGQPDRDHFDYVILASPPSVWSALLVSPNAWHPKNEIGLMGMDPAVKFFTDVKERFWIKRGDAPSGGSSTLGQVWEGTDNQTRIVGRIRNRRGGVLDMKQGIVLSVFAGPILPGGRTPEPVDCIKELTRLYPDYPSNRNETRYSNWPAEPFIKTGYASPRLGDIFDIGRKLNEPFHDLLFFAGEHTRMDLFGYMEGALCSGDRAAKLLMGHLCGIRLGPVTMAASGPPIKKGTAA